MKDVSFATAANAYANTLARAAGAAAGGDTAGAGQAAKPGSGFADLVSNVVDASLNATRAAEQAGMQALSGKAAINDVVATLANAEVMLQTVTTVRDRAISAYQDIMRMPI
jgi:flagellar hook-basal body complex protein FliE